MSDQAAKIPAEFEPLTVEALEPLDGFNRRQAEGVDFWEGDIKKLHNETRSKAHLALKERFHDSEYWGAVFVKKFFVQRLRDELRDAPYARFERLNSDRPGDRQRIAMHIDLPGFFRDRIK